ncbi:hypothetical protein [Streptomyces sp. NPDC049879]|uniref:hypothetical protein n=1 Tax=Streptomyces sp. NPDC049879 TaxID=3365598 RepID=UPI00378DD406
MPTPTPTPARRTPDLVEIHLATAPGDLVHYDHAKLISALKPYGVSDPSTVLVETDGAGGAILTIYRRPPLATVPAARGEDLVMDPHGYITVGRYHDGEPAQMRLYVPGSGAQRSVVFGTTGAGKSRALQLLLAAEKRSGVVSWLADLKAGQSVPEARGNVDVRATTQEGAVLLMQAAIWEAEDRMTRYTAMGRSTFVINRPDRLLSVRVDEANRMLAASGPYRGVGTYYLADAGRAGRSVGVGLGLAAQAAHVEELGGSDTLRAMLREGDVVLLRWSSGVMAGLVGDGILPEDAVLVPIPRTDAPRRLTSRFDRAPGARPPGASTGGMAYLLGSHRPSTLMRFHRVGSYGEVDGPDPEILDLYGPGHPPTLASISPRLAGWYDLARIDGQLDRWAAQLPDIAKMIADKDSSLGRNQVIIAAAQHLITTARPAETVTLTTPQPPTDTSDVGQEQEQGGDTVAGQPPAAAAAAAPPPAVVPAGIPHVPDTPAPGNGQRTAAFRVLAALTDGPLDKQQLLNALAADGGRELSVSRVGAVLSELTRAGRISSPERGRYQLPDRPDPDTGD